MADYQAAPGAPIEYSVQIGGLAGQAATLRVRVYDGPTDVSEVGYPAAGLVESLLTPTVFSKALVAPTTGGDYLISCTNAAGTVVYKTDTLRVAYSAAAASVPAGTDLTTVARVHEVMEKRTASTEIDALIQRHISSVSAILPRRYKRDFAPQGTLTRSVPGRGKIVPLRAGSKGFDLRSVAGGNVILDPSGVNLTLTTAQYALEPYGGSSMDTYRWVNLADSVNLYTSRGYQFDRFELQITGTWGPAAVPEDVDYAAALTVASWLSRPVAAANALESFQGAAGSIRPDKFGGFAIPFAAHQIMQQYEGTVIA